LWPEIGSECWSRHTHDGFTTLPKGMPLILNIMDDMAKGQPVSSTYLDLSCRTFEESFVTLSKPREMAFHAGFDGQRAERTWKQRLNILAELYFINLKEGPSGPASYALILNPYKVSIGTSSRTGRDCARTNTTRYLSVRSRSVTRACRRLLLHPRWRQWSKRSLRRRRRPCRRTGP
jgi:hypothetical protein